MARLPTGSIRRLPSGKWQARMRHPDGRRVALGTFARKGDADRAITLALSDTARGAWADPHAGQIPLADYAGEWLDTRPQPLRPRTRELYECLLRVHIVPALGGIPLSGVTTSRVRRWLADLRTASRGDAVIARAYRLRLAGPADSSVFPFAPACHSTNPECGPSTNRSDQERP